jgi:hypothetical protein
MACGANRARLIGDMAKMVAVAPRGRHGERALVDALDRLTVGGLGLRRVTELTTAASASSHHRPVTS